MKLLYFYRGSTIFMRKYDISFIIKMGKCLLSKSKTNVFAYYARLNELTIVSQHLLVELKNSSPVCIGVYVDI